MIVILFVFAVYSFVLQERSTMKYVANDKNGRISMVDTPEEATRYEILTSVDKDLDIHVAVKGTTQVFDLGNDGINLLVAEQSHKPSQLFQLNLDKEGYFQLCHKNLFLRFDSFMNGLISSKFKIGYHMGFVLFDDTGVFPYPVDISRGIESPYRKKPKLGNSNVNQALPNGRLSESEIYMNNSRKISSEKLKQHNIFVDVREDTADLHAQEHNGAQSYNEFRNINKYNAVRNSQAKHADLEEEHDKENDEKTNKK